MRLEGKRLLVVGASAGIGKTAAIDCARAGARVAVAARRADRLAETVAEAGGQTFAVECDVTREASCARAVSEAVEALGGLDGLVYAPGRATFGPIEEIDQAAWQNDFATNLFGLSLILNEAIAPLKAARGRCVVLSSIIIDDSPPRPFQSTYVVSKRALEALVECWQTEHRDVGFTSIACGDTLSEFGVGLDPEKLMPIVKRWNELDYMYGRMMEPTAVSEHVVNALAARETVRRIAVTPAYPEARDESIDYAAAAIEAQRKHGA